MEEVLTQTEKREVRLEQWNQYNAKRPEDIHDKNLKKLRRLEKQNQKCGTHLLCGSTYISRSEAFHEYGGEYDAQVDKERLRKLYGDEDEVNHLQRVNEYCQYKDFGGWKTKRNGEKSVQKIHRDMPGDYYICPYCSAELLPSEVEVYFLS